MDFVWDMGFLDVIFWILDFSLLGLGIFLYCELGVIYIFCYSFLVDFLSFFCRF